MTSSYATSPNSYVDNTTTSMNPLVPVDIFKQRDQITLMVTYVIAVFGIPGGYREEILN